MRQGRSNLAERNKSRFMQAIHDNLELMQQNDDAIEPHSCGELIIECMYCKALHFKDEQPADKKFSSCCSKGKASF